MFTQSILDPSREGLGDDSYQLNLCNCSNLLDHKVRHIYHHLPHTSPCLAPSRCKGSKTVPAVRRWPLDEGHTIGNHVIYQQWNVLGRFLGASNCHRKLKELHTSHLIATLQARNNTFTKQCGNACPWACECLSSATTSCSWFNSLNRVNCNVQQ